MEVSVTLEDIGELTISNVHPIALQDAVNYAVNGALLLQRELAKTEASDD